MRLLAPAFVALLLVPVAAARDGVTLYPDAAGKLSETFSPEGFEFPLGHTPAYMVQAAPVSGKNTALWSMTLTQDASIVPVHSRLWIEVTEPTVLPPAASPDFEYCPLELSVGVTGVGYYFYCIASETTSSLTPGTYLLDLAWREGLTPIEASAGDTLWMDVWNMGSSTGAHPTIFVVRGEATDPTLTVLDGFNEPEPVPAIAANATDAAQPIAGQPTASTSQTATSGAAPPNSKPSPSSSAPSTRPPVGSQEAVTSDTSSTTPPSATKGAPSLGIAIVALALLALAFRRR